MTKEENISTLNEHLEHWKRLLSEKICDQSEGEKTIDALQNAIKVLEQEPCENVPDLYECPCGYGWDKNKVVRHHFCPNCGRAVDGSIITEQEPCDDCISREATVERLCKVAEFMNEKRAGLGSPYVMAALFIQDNKEEFPSVTPQPKMGRWIDIDDSKSECSICGHREFNERFLFEDINFCAKCGAKMVEPQKSEE